MGVSSLLLSLDASLFCEEEQERAHLSKTPALSCIQRSRSRVADELDSRADYRLTRRIEELRKQYLDESGPKEFVSYPLKSLNVDDIEQLKENRAALLFDVPSSSSVMDVDEVQVVAPSSTFSPYASIAPKPEISVSNPKPEITLSRLTAPLHSMKPTRIDVDLQALDEDDQMVEDIIADSGFKTARQKLDEERAKNGKPSLASTTLNDKKRRPDIEELAELPAPAAKKRMGMTKIQSSIVSKPNGPLHGGSNGLPKTGSPSTSNGVKGASNGSSISKPKSSAPAAKPAESEAEVYKGVDPEIAERVLNEILDTNMNVKWTDISGLEDVKQTLREMIILPNKHPEMFTGLRAPPRGLLLFGPPGNGKTMIAKAIATEAGLTFFSISASVLCSKWIGEGEKTMRALFTIARAKAPSFIFIDEVDSILCSRSSEEHESSRRLKNEFLTQFDGATSSSEEAVTIMGATNRPFDLDDAARRRMPKRIYVPLPEHATRYNLLTNLLKNENHCLRDSDVQRICHQLDGYSCSDIHQLSQQAAMGPVRDKMKSGDMSGALRAINEEDFQRAIETTRPSVAPEECKLYEDFSSKFGTRGL